MNYKVSRPNHEWDGSECLGLVRMLYDENRLNLGCELLNFDSFGEKTCFAVPVASYVGAHGNFVQSSSIFSSMTEIVVGARIITQ